MSGVVKLSVDKASDLIFDALIGAGVAARNARYFSDAILETELSGLDGHGLDWLPTYCAHVESGKVDGAANPAVKRISLVSFRVDAKNGFAHPAIEKGFSHLVPAAQEYGVAAMAVHNSYNAATLGFHTGYLAQQGLVALGFANSPAVMAPVGGRNPVIGTNPFSFAAPGRKGRVAFLVDMASSASSWTAVKQAAEKGEALPEGVAYERGGQPTTDAKAALDGMLAPVGGPKGFALGLVVEAMSAALAGANRGVEMGSMTDDDGLPVGSGQFFIALEPKMFSGGLFEKQIERLIASVTSQPEARMPNDRRAANLKRGLKNGLTIDKSLYERIKAYTERNI
ncbi:(2R)-3-sulfolactate dehydrogenase (NADP+) [Rhizobium sp. SG_E_25_P2]|jgi:(2R)-3-sulfolactate dehydrogenase (NADP+)|uniref:Ldh family oxidoreductase n=1 Tax=Rhizobium sp. SG_E_25_P2 TaxID=2879942 RepID=UPI002474FDF6|nr:Ldh family oxidoreductase [Rhizobium sp. SG_E_25_P2]MDH6265123.1 (2R)-3-sulfolactate dehydrogenase (NADP+) [Rhizobium sp. SG_E_25_P2]